MCSRLRRHTQETDHTQFSITTIGEGKDNNLYEDVLNNLKDVCLRVEDVLRKKGVAVDSGVSIVLLRLMMMLILRYGIQSTIRYSFHLSATLWMISLTIELFYVLVIGDAVV